MKIEEILTTEVVVSLNESFTHTKLMNHYVLFSDDKQIVGEIINIKKDKLIIRLLGE